MADRINLNLRWVQRKLERLGITDVLPQEILNQMSLVELDIMERTGSVRYKGTLTFDVDDTDTDHPHSQGIYKVPTTAHRITLIVPPLEWKNPFRLTNDAYLFEELKAAVTTGTTPQICLNMNDSLYFWPIGTPGDIVTIYAIAQPATEYGQAEGSGDPTVSWHWDEVIRWSTLAMFTEDPKHFKIAQDAYDKEAHVHIMESSSPNIIDHSSRTIGF
jgi:hypothetical protein